MDKRILFLDLDGTLLDDQKQIPEENKQALHKAVELGHQVVIATGRALSRARNGNPFPCPAGVPDGVYRFYGPGGEFLLLGRCAGGTATTIKSFLEV